MIIQMYNEDSFERSAVMKRRSTRRIRDDGNSE